MLTRKSGGRWLVFSTTALLAWQGMSVSSADVVLDGSLGASGPLSGPDFTIDAIDGRTVSTNLFHSFSEFNLSSSQSATFAGPAAIANVLGRVTGGSASSIDGLLRSTIPNANLFLVNPNGLMFGPNASLDINGSFHASTSDYIGLADGTQFTALPSGQDALLTTAIPAAFGFLGSSLGSIDIDHSQLAVPQGQTLSLVGGDITITGTGVDTNGASLTTEGGTVNVISVASPGEATFTSPLNADGFADYGNITVTESTIDVSADTSGSVYIQGGQLVVESANVLSDTVSGDGGDITFKGDGIMLRTGASAGGQVRTSTGGVGDGGDIRVQADSLQVIDNIALTTETRGPGAGGNIVADVASMEVMTGSSVETFAFDSGHGGDITVNADNVTVSGHEASHTGIQAIVFGPFFIPDFTDRSPGASGDGGDITVNARDVRVISGGTIEARTYGMGDAGDVRVAAQHVVVDGNNINRRTRIRSAAGDGDIPFVSFDLTDVIQGNGGEVSIDADVLEMHSDGRIETSTFGTGTGGDLLVDVDMLEITTGADLTTRNAGSGDGGDIKVNADSVTMSGGGSGFTTIGSFVVGPFVFGNYGDPGPGAGGDGGDITVNAHDVRLFGGNIETGTYGTGRGGNLTVNADRVLATNAEARRNTGLRVRVGDGDIPENVRDVIQGDAGNLAVKADSVTVRDGAIFDTATFGAGRAGNLAVEADDVILSGDGSQRRTALRTETFGTGDGGRLTLLAGNLEVLDFAFVSANTDSVGAGGNVIIEADRVLVAGSEGITVETSGAGDGGTLTIRTGKLEVQGPATVSATTVSPGAGGNIIIEADEVLVSEGGANVSAAAIGTGNGGTVTIKARRVEVNGAAFITGLTAGAGRGGDITVEAESVVLTDGGLINAATFDTGDAGDVTLVVGSLLAVGDGTVPPRGLFDFFDSFTSIQSSSFTVERNTLQGKAGDAGDVSVTANHVELRDGATMESITLFSGEGGNVSVNTHSLIIRSGSRIDVSTLGPGSGGDIDLTANTITLAGDGVQGFTGISAVAEPGATGNAGNINIEASDTFESFGGSVTAAADQSDGGNIEITAANRVHLVDSSIETEVQGGAGAGGNITIDPQFVVLNNSRIIANAFGGPGGNIRIAAGNFFSTPNSLVQASSAQSIDGTVEIDSPDTDIAGSITALPESFLDATALLPQRCAARHGRAQSSFVVAGRGGLPIDPDGYLPSFYVHNLTTLSSSADSADHPLRKTEVAQLGLANSGCR